MVVVLCVYTATFFMEKLSGTILHKGRWVTPPQTSQNGGREGGEGGEGEKQTLHACIVPLFAPHRLKKRKTPCGIGTIHLKRKQKLTIS